MAMRTTAVAVLLTIACPCHTFVGFVSSPAIAGLLVRCSFKKMQV